MLTQSILVYNSPHSRVVLEYHHSGNNTHSIQYYFIRNWPMNIYVCQIIYKERNGVPFVMITGFNINKRDKKLLWLTALLFYIAKKFGR